MQGNNDLLYTRVAISIKIDLKNYFFKPLLLAFEWFFIFSYKKADITPASILNKKFITIFFHLLPLWNLAFKYGNSHSYTFQPLFSLHKYYNTYRNN